MVFKFPGRAQQEFAERGALYVMLPALIFALLAFCAFVIDLVMAMASQEQQLHMCEYAAIAALDTYLEADVSSAGASVDAQSSARLNAALARANEVIALNTMLSNKVEDGHHFDPLALDSSSINTTPSQPGPGGLLVPGNFKMSPENCPPEKEKCFVPTAFGERAVSAFQCQARLASPIQTLLAHIFGQQTLDIGAQAIASAAPKQLLIAMDLSMSTTRKFNFKRFPSNVPEAYRFNPPIPYSPFWGCSGPALTSWGIASEYSYQLPLELDNNFPWNEDPEFLRLYIDDGVDEFGFPDGSPDTMLPENGCGPNLHASNINWTDRQRLLKPKLRPGPSAQWIKYQSDYEVFEFLAPGAFPSSSCLAAASSYDLNYNPVYNENAANFGCWLIDTYRYDESFYPNAACTGLPFCAEHPNFEPEAAYYGPEPLTTLLYGVRHAIDEFIARANGGDRLGLLTFEDEPVEKVEPPFRFWGMQPPWQLEGLITPEDRKSLIEKGLFPRLGHHTNIELGMQQALDELETSSGSGEKSVLLITDGLDNCVNGDDCVNSISNKGLAYLEFMNLMLPQYVEQEIAINIIQIHAGATQPHSLPHTFNIQRTEYQECCANACGYLCANQAGICSPACAEIPRWENDKEAMQAGHEFVETEVHAAGAIYPGPHKFLWDVAKATGGRYLVLREPPPDSCETPTGESVCAYATEFTDCVPRSPLLAPGPMFTPQPQKQEYDPFCRTKMEQVEDFMAEIVNEGEGVVLSVEH